MKGTGLKSAERDPAGHATWQMAFNFALYQAKWTGKRQRVYRLRSRHWHTKDAEEGK